MVKVAARWGSRELTKAKSGWRIVDVGNIYPSLPFDYSHLGARITFTTGTSRMRLSRHLSRYFPSLLLHVQRHPRLAEAQLVSIVNRQVA